MSRQNGDVLGVAKSVNGCERGLGVTSMVHTPDCFYAQSQCRKLGLKRRRSSSDVTAVNDPVKVEDPNSESYKPQNKRSVLKPCVAIQERRHEAPTTPDVSCTQGAGDEDGVGNASHDESVDSLCQQALQSELRRRTEELLVTQGQRDAAFATMRAHLAHHLKQVQSIETELQAELWRITEEIKIARQQRDKAIARKQLQLERQCDQVYEVEMKLQMELQKARRDLLLVHQQRDDALKELDSQAKHQQEQVNQIETELQGRLRQTLEEIEVVRKQRDDAIAEKHAQLEQQCDVVYDIEMGLQKELRGLLNELESARKEHEAAVSDLHLQQAYQHEQVYQVEMELQGQIQLKSEELKVVQKERDQAISHVHSQLELQCDQATQVEMQLQRDLQHVLGELQSVQERPGVIRESVTNGDVFPPLDHHFNQAREIEEALVLSREKLNGLKQQPNNAGETKSEPTFPESQRSAVGAKQIKAKSLKTQKKPLKVR